LKKYLIFFCTLLVVAVGGYAAYCHWLKPTRILIVNALQAQQADFTLNNDSRHISVECIDTETRIRITHYAAS